MNYSYDDLNTMMYYVLGNEIYRITQPNFPIRDVDTFKLFLGWWISSTTIYLETSH